MRICVAALLLALASPALGADSFVPNPHAVFDGFVAIRSPRPDVPVGALWIQGYGPTGDGAAPDNLETVRSLNGVTIDKNLQLSLSAGLFAFLGIDPHLRDHFTAHFTDLTIVRVKDASKLSGPPSEPRIVAALKAGSITVTSDGDVGLNARTIGFDQTRVQGTTTNDRSRTFSIDGRDLFIAVHVATLRQVVSKPRELVLAPVGERAGVVLFDDDRLMISNVGCTAAGSGCTGAAAVVLTRAGEAAPSQSVALDGHGEASLLLTVPRSDGATGLYTRLRIALIPSCGRGKQEGCGRHDRVEVRYAGESNETLADPTARAW